MSPPGARLCGPTAAARYLGVSRATLHRMVKAGRLTPAGRTPGGFARFSLDDLRRLASTLSAPSPDVAESNGNDLTHDAVRRYHVLVDVAQQLSGTHTIDSSCMAAAVAVRNALPSGDQVTVSLLDARAGVLRRRVDLGFPPGTDTSPYDLAGSSITAQVMRSGVAYVCEDVHAAQLSRAAKRRADRANLRAFASIPIIGSRRVEGVLGIGSRHPAVFPQSDLAFLAQLARLLAGALETAFEHERFVRVHDTIGDLSSLTGSGASRRDLAVVAAETIGALSEANAVLVSQLSADRLRLEWLAGFTGTAARLADLPSVPIDRATIEAASRLHGWDRQDDPASLPTAGAEAQLVAERLGTPVWYAFPLVAGAKLVGSVGLGFRTDQQLSQSALRAIACVAEYLALVLREAGRTEETASAQSCGSSRGPV